MMPASLHFFPFFHFHPFFLLLSLLLYFLPAFIARDKPSFTPILILNIFAGWTFIGWIIALIWAITADQPRQMAPAYQQVATAAVPPPATAVFFCSSCGKRCTTGERFCSSCGSALPAVSR